MLDMYKNFYKMGLMTASDIHDVVVYMPIMGITKLDYENITGNKWPSEPTT